MHVRADGLAHLTWSASPCELRVLQHSSECLCRSQNAHCLYGRGQSGQDQESGPRILLRSWELIRGSYKISKCWLQRYHLPAARQESYVIGRRAGMSCGDWPGWGSVRTVSLTHDRISFLTYFFVIRVPRSAPLGRAGLADPLCMENECKVTSRLVLLIWAALILCLGAKSWNSERDRGSSTPCIPKSLLSF